jgi:hypothetical protein
VAPPLALPRPTGQAQQAQPRRQEQQSPLLLALLLAPLLPAPLLRQGQ